SGNLFGGTLSEKQTLTVEGTCAGYGRLSTEGDVTNGGTIVLRSSGCSEYPWLEVQSEKTLTNKGTISVEGGSGERYLYGAVLNDGTVSIADKQSLYAYGQTFTNAAGGKVAGAGSGHMAVHETFVQGAGTTQGAMPVLL